MPLHLSTLPTILLARNALARLPEFTPPAARTLLVYNGAQPDIPHAAVFRQRGEPTVNDIDAALQVARESRCDFVIGLGGGSAIDAAKAAAGLLANGGMASDYMEVVGKGQKITQAAVPWIAIPTTAGTGAEVTRNAVIGWPEKKFKASIRSELLTAKAALIDPQLAVDVPHDVTARSGMDALCQCIEAYVSNGASAFTDAIAIKGIELAARYLARACDDGHDLEAREGMATAALLSGIALTNAGLGAVHGFAAPLGANFPIPHGVACGVLLPHVIAANRRRGVTKYDDIDRTLGADAAETCAGLVHQLNLPRLASFGVRTQDVPAMVDLAKRASSMRYNPVVLDDATLADVLTQSL